jgi:formiminotetrahydrofolate cyclodeaminase
MVCRLTIGRASPDESATLTDLATTYDRLVDQLSQAARDDELCFAGYQAATRLPKGTDDERRMRTAARQEALRLAAEAPLHAGELAVNALQSLPTVAKLGTHHALSDLRVARILLDASLKGSLINVQVNLEMITDEAVTQTLAVRVSELRSSAKEATAQVEAELALRG